jgi:hypothetical protein
MRFFPGGAFSEMRLAENLGLGLDCRGEGFPTLQQACANVPVYVLEYLLAPNDMDGRSC